MQRYALMESKQYQNIPRTIQNVLLNSKLDAEFIKKTIISSLNEEDTSVDLNTYKETSEKTSKHGFAILKSSKTRNAETGCRDHPTGYGSKPKTDCTGARLPGTGCRPHQGRRGAPPMGEKKNRQKTTGISYWPAAWNCRSSRKRNVTGCRKCWLLSTMNCRKLLRKKRIRPAEHFPDCRTVSQKRKNGKNRQQGLQEEQRILTSQYTEISTKYKLLIQSLDEQWNKIHEAKLKQQEELGNTYNSRMEEARKLHETATEALYQEYEQLSQTLHPEYNEKRRL